MDFTFNRGSWEDGNNLPEWRDNEDFEDYLKRVGFSASQISFGNEDLSSIDIFESSEGNSFYASICPFNGFVYTVHLPDFPSLMMFIRDYTAAFSAKSSNSATQEVLTLLEKLFELQKRNATY